MDWLHNKHEFSACHFTWYYETANGNKTKGIEKVCLESSAVFASESTLSACPGR